MNFSLQAWLIVALGGLLAIGGAGAFGFHKGDDYGRAQQIAAQQRATDAAVKEVDRRDAASAATSDSMLEFLRASLPATEEKANEATERVRTIYVDRPAKSAAPGVAPGLDVACLRPDGVQDELDAARQRANAATRGLRQGPANGDASADSAVVPHGRVGDASHGDL
jgi:hypothetical protein